jgi:hypothetical protein
VRTAGIGRAQAGREGEGGFDAKHAGETLGKIERGICHISSCSAIEWSLVNRAVAAARPSSRPGIGTGPISKLSNGVCC